MDRPKPPVWKPKNMDDTQIYFEDLPEYNMMEVGPMGQQNLGYSYCSTCEYNGQTKCNNESDCNRDNNQWKANTEAQVRLENIRAANTIKNSIKSERLI